MTLREAIDAVERHHFGGGLTWEAEHAAAVRMVIDAAREHADDTVEIVTISEAHGNG